MRLPRITIRQWMFIVVAVGLVTGGIVGGIRLKRRQEHFGELAERYAALESLCLEVMVRQDANLKQTTKELNVFEKYPPVSGPTLLEQTRTLLRESQDRQAASARKLAQYARLKQKYEYAARYPWLPVEPDPPKPE
jgi:hypothetical protein